MNQSTEPYSLSIYWNDGAIVAAQRETKTVIRDDSGSIIHHQPNPAEEIPFDLGVAILGDVNAGLLKRIADDEKRHQDQIAELQSALRSAANRISELEAGEETFHQT